MFDCQATKGRLMSSESVLQLRNLAQTSTKCCLTVHQPCKCTFADKIKMKN